MLKNLKALIELNPAVMGGKPVFRGTRITVERVLRELSGGWTGDEVLRAHPDLAQEHILAALDYAADTIANEEVLLGGESCQ